MIPRIPVPIPNDPTLVGFAGCVQAVSVGTAGPLYAMSNALDFVIG